MFLISWSRLMPFCLTVRVYYVVRLPWKKKMLEIMELLMLRGIFISITESKRNDNAKHYRNPPTDKSVSRMDKQIEYSLPSLYVFKKMFNPIKLAGMCFRMSNYYSFIREMQTKIHQITWAACTTSQPFSRKMLDRILCFTNFDQKSNVKKSCCVYKDICCELTLRTSSNLSSHEPI